MIHSVGAEANKEHSGKFEEAYLGDIIDEVTDWTADRYDGIVTIHTTREFFFGSSELGMAQPPQDAAELLMRAFLL